MELITGAFPDGELHVSSADDGELNASVVGTGCYVTQTGDMLECTMEDANTALVGTGAGWMNGRGFRVTTSEEVTIENGSQGTYRNDLLGVLYEVDDEGYESASLSVVKGTASSSGATDPDYDGSSILDGATTSFFPLWRIPIEGISVGTPESMFDVLVPMADLSETVTALGDSVSQYASYTSTACTVGSTSFTPTWHEVRLWTDGTQEVVLLWMSQNVSHSTSAGGRTNVKLNYPTSFSSVIKLAASFEGAGAGDTNSRVDYVNVSNSVIDAYVYTSVAASTMYLSAMVVGLRDA